MLKPRGPNLRLSCMIPWKNVNEKTNLCQSVFLCSTWFKKSSDNSTKDFLRLAFKPRGG